MHPKDDEDVISLGFDDEEDDDGYYDDDEAYAPGPDARDMDLMDGTWEQKYYTSEHKQRDWNTVALAIAIIVVIAMVVPSVLVIL